MRKTVNKENVEKTEIKWRKFKMNENEEVVNRKEVGWNLEKVMKITEEWSQGHLDPAWSRK